MPQHPSEAQTGSRILVVEDDAKIADMLANYLQAQGYAAAVVGDGHAAVAAMRDTRPGFDLMLLDLMLPGLDGLQVCRSVRQFSDVPIIMVTARVDEIDRLLGLEIGADDYVCKPFSPREVVARIKALLRRSRGQLLPAATMAEASGWSVDDAGMRVHWRGTLLPLTPVEFRLLRELRSRAGQVLARARLLDLAHSDLRDVSDRAIDSHIKNLRKKIEAVHPDGSCIASVYGVGYRWDGN